MRMVTLVLVLLLAAIQYPLWFGHGGWLYVHELRDELSAEQQKNEQLKERNDRLAGEVQDLQEGTAAIEERARFELGMVKDGEVFVQFVAPDGSGAPPSASGAGAPLVSPAEPAHKSVAAAPPTNPPSQTKGRAQRH
ncbi:cell division protein FtsB [Pandoraea nosoerga]|uniref:Cell division protein FtsB n=1 Tax=Pandoraea nosoerga TaxID=2508296 RepID=A0A5E4TRL4_9BURK|nr:MULTISPECIES: cell division protein FtsB [Pandoraea]MBN4664921.1 cell division protein FtsB [Pandoraea nosoerga]MBN4675363.1 cell division protein FtsB [Pandoraea nosoerga]MBN4680664.1 cell division protein FtsB [Pandoraea nosoerga]MBN4745850.1 cell division protein FtsB [Pandoraea nosoerga]VVD89862.1 cell division protein FtsB [Pandoraea nosoerga]